MKLAFKNNSVSARRGVSQKAPRYRKVLAVSKFPMPSLDNELGKVVAPEISMNPPELHATVQLQRWLGARALNTSTIKTGVKGADAQLAVVGTLVEANQELHAIIAVAVREGKASEKPALDNLALYWAASARPGGQWSSPPPSSSQYPPRLMQDIVTSGAWRSPFALHPSTDGRPMHVVMIQVTLEGALKKGGIVFVLNHGQHNQQWSHSSQTGSDWFVQLDNFLPISSTQGLPNSKVPLDLFPLTLAPSPIDPEEVSDRTFLHKELHVREAEIAERRKKAANSAQSSRDKASDVSSQRAKAVVAAREAKELLTASEIAVEAAKHALSIAAESFSEARTQVEEARKVARAAEDAVKSQGGSLSPQPLSFSFFTPPPQTSPEVLAAQVVLEKLKQELGTASAAVGAAEASKAASESNVQGKANLLTRSNDALSSASALVRSTAKNLADLSESEARLNAQALAAEQAASEVEAQCQLELKALVAKAEEARSRLTQVLLERQVLDLKRFMISSQGPETPLNLAYLLPSIMSGRASLPPVPSSMGQSKLTVKGSFTRLSQDGSPVPLMEEASALRLQPCSFEDLCSVVRIKLRSWLHLETLDELHALQVKDRLRLPDNSEIPVVVWITALEASDAEGRVQALFAISVDQSAAGGPNDPLQLIWGGALREGQGPVEIPSTMSLKSSAVRSWESRDVALCTPASSEWVLPLGATSKRSMRNMGQKFEKVDLGAYEDREGDELMEMRWKRERAVARAAAAAPDCPAPDRKAHCVLLQLPLEGMMGRGGLSFSFRDAEGRTLLNSDRRHFFINTETLAQHGLAYVKFLTTPPLPPSPPPQANEISPPANNIVSTPFTTQIVVNQAIE